MRIAYLIAAMLAVVLAFPALAGEREILIWPGKAPGSESWTHQEIEYTEADAADPSHTPWKKVRNVVTPTLTVFRPTGSKANGTAVIIAPGGGFHSLSWESDGAEVARWLTERGVTAFILKYRVVHTPEDPEAYRQFRAASTPKIVAALKAGGVDWEEQIGPVHSMCSADGRQAVKVVRAHAADWNISPDRIGIIGFSAGGAPVMGAAMDPEANGRPNFAASIYGVGKVSQPIPSGAPPLFIVATADDLVAAEPSARLYMDWHKAGHSAELHVFATGGHGFALKKQGLPSDHWIDLFDNWLDSQGFLKKPSQP